MYGTRNGTGVGLSAAALERGPHEVICALLDRVQMMKLFLTLPLGALGATAPISTSPSPPPAPTSFAWLDPSVPTAQRVSMLLGNLTNEEKNTLMSTDAAAVPRLKVPAYAWWSEGAHGVAWAGVATVFPALVGAGASFDVDAVRQMGTAIGMEGRAKHNARVKAQGNSPEFYGLDFFAPNINIVRDVRWGRGQETFGEDPFLTATLGVELIRGLQGNASYGEKYPLVGATAKVRATHNTHTHCSRGRRCCHPPLRQSPMRSLLRTLSRVACKPS